MFGRREAGVLGATVVLAGGVAYLIWNYVSSSGEKKPETRPEKDGKSAREEGEGKEGERKEEQVVAAAAAAAPVVGATAQKAPEVKTVTSPDTPSRIPLLFLCLKKTVEEEETSMFQRYTQNRPNYSAVRR